MKEINHALIMAAGRGLRMMPLTAVVPKPMSPYLGSTLIADGIGKIRPYIKNIHITVGYKGATLAQHVIEHGVTSVFNTSEKGNAWWIYNTLMKGLDEPVIVLTCDNVVELEFDQLAREYYAFNQPACMLVPVKPVAGLEGDYIFQEKNIVTKLDRHEPSDRYCSGIQILNPARINQLTSETNDFYSLWNQLIRQRQLLSSDIYPKRWYAVDTLAQLESLNRHSYAENQPTIEIASSSKG
jgi:NDP-sugar pyrophosphorylase family protein